MPLATGGALHAGVVGEHADAAAAVAAAAVVVAAAAVGYWKNCPSLQCQLKCRNPNRQQPPIFDQALDDPSRWLWALKAEEQATMLAASQSEAFAVVEVVVVVVVVVVVAAAAAELEDAGDAVVAVVVAAAVAVESLFRLCAFE